MKAPWPLPRWVAHRGAGRLAPENTLAAFRVGAAHGWRAFECDVKLSADGVPFLLHDARLDRCTSARGPAAERSWAELSRLDAGSWHSRGFAGEPLASLQAVARFVLRNGFALNVEIKPSPGQAAATGAAVALACQRLWHDAPAPPLLSSFEPEALQAAQQAAPALPRALLLDTLWTGWANAAQALGCIGLVAHHALIDAAWLAEVRAQGHHVGCYTVNDPAEAHRLLALGVDSLISDAVDRFSPAGEGIEALG